MPPETITYPHIQPLLQTAEQKGSRLSCIFVCPASGKSARATVDVVAANDSIATKARSKLRTSALRSLTRSLGKTMRSVLGNNVVGRLAGELVNDKGKAIAGQGGFTQAELECAKLAAFEQVRAQFTWAEERAGFVHRSAVDGSQAAR